jgi:Anti-sigma factor NepR
MTKIRQTKRKLDGKQSNVDLPAMGPTPSHSEQIGMHDLLGNKLRDYYDQVAREPVPDRFVQLLKQLEAKGEQDQS